MRNMKRKGLGAIAVLLAVAMAAGCGSSGGAQNQGGGAESSGEGPKYTFRLAETHPADYPTTKGDMKFAELVNERSGGRITIDVFPSAQLGEEKSVIEQVQLGAIEFTRVSTGPMAEFNKDFGVFSLPYIFDSDEHVWNFLLGETGMSMLDTLQSSGLQGLGWYSSGSRSFYTTKPVNGIEDLKGMKIRVQENKVNLAIIEALGASATPMPYGDVYSGLSTGIIDGAENNYPSYYSSKHYEVAPHLILDGHQRLPEVLLVSKPVWDKLSAEDQELIRQAALDSIDYQREEWANYEKESEEAVRAAGVTITEVTDLGPWQDTVKPVIDSYHGEYGTLLDAIEAAK